MAEFLVKVADERGRLTQQVENGYSEAEVRERFAQQGFLVYWVKPKGLRIGGGGRRRKVRQSTFLVFNQQILTLLKAGLPVLSSLDLLIKRQRDTYFRALLQNVRDRVKGRRAVVGGIFGAERFPQDLHDHADGGREERQHGRSADPLHQFSAHGVDLQEEAGGFAGVSGAADHHGVRHVHLF